MKAQYDARVGTFQGFLVVSVAEESQHHSFDAKRGFDDVREIFFLRDGVGIFQRLTTHFLMAVEVVVGTVGNAPEFSPTEREGKLKVGRCFGLEAKFFGFMVAETEIFFFDTEVE